MSLRVGHLNFLNTLPFYLHLQENSNVTLVPGCPADLNAGLASGDLDLSMVSSWSWLTHRDEWDIIPGYCIATDQAVGSVNLYHSVPIKELDGQPLALTRQTATSAQLLKVLCESFWHVAPRFESLPSVEAATDYPAVLLIGDEALARPEIDGYTTLDLATAWYEKTLLPLPFAVLTVRRAVVQERGDEVTAFAAEFEASLSWAEENLESVVQFASLRSGLPLPTLRAYYDLLDYRLKQPQWDGLRTFATLAHCSALKATL